MDMPKPWVILISVELFWPESLSYFEESALVIQKQANWVIFGHENHENCIIHEYFVLTHTNFKAPRVIFLVINPKYAESLSYSLKVLSYFQNLELFCHRNPWVIFATTKKKPDLDSMNKHVQAHTDEINFVCAVCKLIVPLF